jgi:hypothetical protein
LHIKKSTKKKHIFVSKFSRIWEFLEKDGGDKIVPIIAFGGGLLVELPPRCSWLRQETSEMLPSDGVIFYTDGLLCGGTAGAAGVFSDTLDICKEILCTWLSCYRFSNRGICNSRQFWLLSERKHAQHDDLYMFW